MRVAAGIDETWRRVLAAGALRGSLAGYTGTAVLEEADDDERVARFRLQGVRDGAPATATVTAALAPAGDATEVDLRAEVHGDAAPNELLAAVAEVVGPAMAAAAEPAAEPPAIAGPDEAAPAAPPAVAAPAEGAAPGLSAPAKGAIVAAGAALAVWALRRRR